MLATAHECLMSSNRQADALCQNTLENVAVVLKGYPRLSETFIAQELLGLQQRGLHFSIYSLRQPTDVQRHPIHDEINVPVHYLPEYLYRAPLRTLKGLIKVCRRRGFALALSTWIRDLRRDRTANRVRRFGQALVLAAELPDNTGWIYAHFLHTPASVARYAAMINGTPWSCSAHAKDIYTSPDWELIEKLEDLQWLVTCTEANRSHLANLAPNQSSKINLLYHGIDLSRFPPPGAINIRPQPTPITILSVGRAVAKKGYRDLLQALSLLPDDLDWKFIHIGGGDLLPELKSLAHDLALHERIEWLGAKTQDQVMDAYRAADLFVLASRIADDGDRDGLPNVLLEAQSQGVACVSTAVSAIPELINNGQTGLLVEPGAPNQLAGAIAKLACDLSLRQKLGAAGQARVRENFGHDRGITTLAHRFGLGGDPAC